MNHAHLPYAPGIYLITNKVNGKKYVGSSIKVRKRVGYHFSGHGSTVLKNAVEKYGKKNFEASLLESCQRSDLPSREAFWIGKICPAYNITLLTESGGHIVSPETGRKISQAKIGFRHSDAAKDKLKADWATGDHSARIEKMRDANLGRKQSDETKAKRSASLKGRIIPSEQRERMIAAAKVTKAARKLPPEEFQRRRRISEKNYRDKKRKEKDQA